MSLIASLNTAASGLRVATTGLNVTSHNVANSTTEGFSKRSLRTTTADPIDRYGIGLGQGARGTDVRRTTNFLVNQSLVTAVGKESRSQARFMALAGVEASFDELGQSGPSALLDDFFDALNELSRDPADLSLRQGVLTTADRLALAVNQTAQDLRRGRDDVLTELDESLPVLQAKLDEVAELNGRVVAAGSELAAGDLADRRDQLVTELAQDLGVTARFLGDGTAQVFIGTHAVVSGARARELTLGQDAVTGAPELLLSADAGQINVTSFVGGRLGGLFDADADMSAVITDLDTFAADFATAVNAQHAAGFDRAGAPGGDVFTFTPGDAAASFALDATLAADPQRLAAAGAATAEAGDADNLFLLIALESTALFSAGTETSGEFLSGIYAEVGRRTATAELDQQAAELRLADLAELRDSISGVDLDQEATELMAWQAAYEASARVVSAANQMLSELMDMVR